jgi:hypothetical protein
MLEFMTEEEKKAPPATGDAQSTQTINTDKRSGAVNLPPITSFGQLRSAKIDERPEVIEGVLRERCKLGIAGAAKAKKTYLLLALACSVATGSAYLDKLKTNKGRVLYVNLELHPDTLRDRISKICEALELDIATVEQNLHVLNLRSYPRKEYNILVPKLVEHMLDAGKHKLCIIDPLYKILGDTNENDSGAVTRFMNELETICASTGAALALAMHYGKGNQAARQEGDRARGSSVFFGDLDALIEFNEQQDSDKKQSKDVLVAQFPGLREYKPIPDFCVEWDGVATFSASSHDPRKMKKVGAQSRYSVEQVLDVLKKSKKSLTTGEWLALAKTEIGIGKTKFHEFKDELYTSGRLDYNKDTQTYFAIPAGVN